LLQPDFDLIEHFNKTYNDDSALNNLAAEIEKHDKEVTSIDQEIKSCIRTQAHTQEKTREDLVQINEEAISLIDKIKSVKSNASQSQSIVEGGC